MAKGDGKGGVVRDLVAEAAREHAALTAPGEQLDMLVPPTRFDGERALAVARETARNVAGGRPAGSVNLATKEFRDFMLKTGVSPLVQMMRWSMLTPTALAAELKITRAEAFAHLKDLWRELAPYLHQQMPRAVEIDQRSAGLLILGTIDASQTAALAQKFGVADLQLAAQEVPVAQALPSGEAAKSQTEKSQTEGK